MHFEKSDAVVRRPVIVLDIFSNWCDIYKVVKVVYGNRSDKSL